MKLVSLVAVILISLLAMPAFATVQFNDGGMHNIDYLINDNVWVDYQAPGIQTTVNLLNGGALPLLCDLSGYNDSRINISSGSVGNVLYSYDNSQVTISGGSVTEMIFASGNSQVTMSGGSANALSAGGNSQVIISGGSVTHGCTASGNGQITISGGVVSGSTVRQTLVAANSGHISWSGGTIGESQFLLYQTATVSIYGSNFAIDGIPFGSHQITSILGADPSNEPYRQLTGTLANGDIINNPFRVGYSASINLVAVPEPSSLLALSAGLLGIVGFIRRRA